MKQPYDGNLLSPLPVALVGALVQGRPNYLVIGYIAPFDFGKYVFFSLFKGRYTSQGIHENSTFSVNIPSSELLQKVQFCGNHSGRVVDKTGIFKTFFGKVETAPMIGECPINLECKLVQVLDYGRNEGIIGEVVQSYVRSTCLTDGKVDFRRVDPLIWVTGGDFHFYRLGDRI